MDREKKAVSPMCFSLANSLVLLALVRLTCWCPNPLCLCAFIPASLPTQQIHRQCGGPRSSARTPPQTHKGWELVASLTAMFLFVSACIPLSAVSVFLIGLVVSVYMVLKARQSGGRKHSRERSPCLVYFLLSVGLTTKTIACIHAPPLRTDVVLNDRHALLIHRKASLLSAVACQTVNQLCLTSRLCRPLKSTPH